MTYEYDEEVLEVFLENQSQLFDERVAETPEEAEDFLDMCMAVVCDDIKEVKEYLSEVCDISGMSIEEIQEASEVFPLSDGRYLVVEG
jgi:hypothetical protein